MIQDKKNQNGYSITWNRGIGYLQINPSLASYILLVIVNVICAVLGFFSLFKYTRGDYEVAMEDVVMERKFDTVRVGVSMFVHSMKNQLLANKVIYKRIDQIYSQPELDTVKLKECIDALRTTNDTMLTRIEELYRSVKSNSITMMPVNIQEIIDTTLERFHNKFPDAIIFDIRIVARKEQKLYNIWHQWQHFTLRENIILRFQQL